MPGVLFVILYECYVNNVLVGSSRFFSASTEKYNSYVAWAMREFDFLN
jgi:hypothetical protein